MPLIRATARPMLAAMFVTGGLDAVLHPKAKAQAAVKVAPFIAKRLPFPLTEDPVQLVRINGAVQLVAGLALATGRLPRLAAVTLAGSLIPTTLAGHRFWEKSDTGERAMQQQQFTKNLSMLGGLILAAVDLEGRPGLRHRGHDAVRELKHVSHDVGHQAHATSARATGAARRLSPVG
jgi:putative oxidoreductase